DRRRLARRARYKEIRRRPGSRRADRRLPEHGEEELQRKQGREPRTGGGSTREHGVFRTVKFEVRANLISRRRKRKLNLLRFFGQSIPHVATVTSLHTLGMAP